MQQIFLGTGSKPFCGENVKPWGHKNIWNIGNYLTFSRRAHEYEHSSTVQWLKTISATGLHEKTRSPDDA